MDSFRMYLKTDYLGISIYADRLTLDEGRMFFFENRTSDGAYHNTSVVIHADRVERILFYDPKQGYKEVEIFNARMLETLQTPKPDEAVITEIMVLLGLETPAKV